MKTYRVVLFANDEGLETYDLGTVEAKNSTEAFDVGVETYGKGVDAREHLAMLNSEYDEDDPEQWEAWEDDGPFYTVEEVA